VGDAGAELGVSKNAVTDRKCQVESAPIPFQMIDDTKTLLAVPEAREGFGQRCLTGVPERRVSEIVAETDRLDEVLVEKEGPADGTSYLRDLEGVGETGSVVVASGSDEDLGLVHQPAKTLGVEDTVAVALKRGPQFTLWFQRLPLCPAAWRGTGGKEVRLVGFKSFPNRGHGLRHNISLKL